jgi:aspartokinase
MIGSPVIPYLLFEKLKEIKANTLIITKGSSEHSISIGIMNQDTERVYNALLDQFYRVSPITVD